MKRDAAALESDEYVNWTAGDAYELISYDIKGGKYASLTNISIALADIYGDKNRSACAEADFLRLEQGQRSFALFYIDFRKTMRYLQHSDQIQ
ncbi:hypothetical protein BPAE_0258g00090 [Botrytis paeoniae]|uniref:Uncharacterized protein n=1 Tax=Botrytis paeoniae TaxID=278948 RepID=A0A4Z1FBI6_9HELO|nr:hypothetical protein BPAE_0258g00090 [Botrytis paeoniae]